MEVGDSRERTTGSLRRSTGRKEDLREGSAWTMRSLKEFVPMSMEVKR